MGLLALCFMAPAIKADESIELYEKMQQEVRTIVATAPTPKAMSGIGLDTLREQISLWRGEAIFWSRLEKLAFICLLASAFVPVPLSTVVPFLCTWEASNNERHYNWMIGEALVQAEDKRLIITDY